MTEEKKHPRPATTAPPYPPPMEDEPPTDPRIRLLRKQFFTTRVIVALFTGGFSAVSLGAVLVASEKLRDVAADAGAKGAKEVVGDVEATKRKIEVVDADLQQHKAADAQAQRELKEDVHAMREELREVYKSNRSGDRSPVLERPVPPLPPPQPTKDGGR